MIFVRTDCKERQIPGVEATFYPESEFNTVSDEQHLKELKESIESGLIVDEENKVFVKEGYGALVGKCPDNCNSMEDLLSFSSYDRDRKAVGKPTISERMKEKLKELKGEYNLENYYAGFQMLIDEGYDLVVGPGCSFYGNKVEKAIYCRNYQEMIEKENSRSK